MYRYIYILHVLLLQGLVPLVMFLHLESDVVDGVLKLSRHFFSPLLLFTCSLATLLLVVEGVEI